MTTRHRAAAVIGVGLGSFALALCFRLVLHQQSSDFDQIVVGARRVVSGETPYTLTPLPGLQWPIYYPMPAVILGLPFIRCSLPLAHATFCGISGACFGWAMTGESGAKLFALGTWPYVLSVSLGQWAPLLMAATAIPMLGWLTIAKPNLGLALAAGYGSRWVRRPALWVNLVITAGLVAVSFALRPQWLTEWITVLSTPTPHLIMPVRVAGGFLLLLALVRWKEPEARTLAALAFVPQTFSSYDSLLVFLVPRTRRESLVLVAATTIVTGIVGYVGPAQTYAETVQRFAPLRIALVYLPAVAIILFRQDGRRAETQTGLFACRHE
jgi:hypothetical protein